MYNLKTKKTKYKYKKLDNINLIIYIILKMFKSKDILLYFMLHPYVIISGKKKSNEKLHFYLSINLPNLSFQE